MNVDWRPPIFLTDLTSVGTLAAVRCLGKAGVRVTVGGAGFFSVARWSRYATDYWECQPGASEAAALAALALWSKLSQRHVLLASSDEMAWMYSCHKAELEKSFTIYVPELKALDAILDKEKLAQACGSAGIATVPTWFPADRDALHRLAETLPYPILIKPRRHVFRVKNDKGFVVESPADLKTQFDWIAGRERELTLKSGKDRRPMPLLQQFIPAAVENIVSVSGFIDKSGTRHTIRASRKLMQRALPVGIGVTFEAIDVDPILAQTAIDLCRRLGYFGVFEIEFIYCAQEWRVIDFNPRFYHQMALDVKEGALLPLLAYLDACGDIEALDRVIRSGADAAPSPHHGFTDTLTSIIVWVFRSLTRQTRPFKALQWRWQKRGRIVDAAFALNDPLPWLIHVISEMRLAALAVPRLAKIRCRQTGASPAELQRWQA